MELLDPREEALPDPALGVLVGVDSREGVEAEDAVMGADPEALTVGDTVGVRVTIKEEVEDTVTERVTEGDAEELLLASGLPDTLGLRLALLDAEADTLTREEWETEGDTVGEGEAKLELEKEAEGVEMEEAVCVGCATVGVMVSVGRGDAVLDRVPRGERVPEASDPEGNPDWVGGRLVPDTQEVALRDTLPPVPLTERLGRGVADRVGGLDREGEAEKEGDPEGDTLGLELPEGAVFEGVGREDPLPPPPPPPDTVKEAESVGGVLEGEGMGVPLLNDVTDTHVDMEALPLGDMPESEGVGADVPLPTPPPLADTDTLGVPVGKSKEGVERGDTEAPLLALARLVSDTEGEGV